MALIHWGLLMNEGRGGWVRSRPHGASEIAHCTDRCIDDDRAFLSAFGVEFAFLYTRKRGKAFLVVMVAVEFVVCFALLRFASLRLPFPASQDSKTN